MADVKEWSVETVATWMEKRGFSDVAKVCREKEIDGLLLVNMSQEEVVEECGVSPLQAKKLVLHLEEERAVTAPTQEAAVTAPQQQTNMQPPRRRGGRGRGVVGGAALGAAGGAAKVRTEG